jgi:hypothetical protein
MTARRVMLGSVGGKGWSPLLASTSSLPRESMRFSSNAATGAGKRRRTPSGTTSASARSGCCTMSLLMA